MNVLSLFDGMSCGQIALERAGIKVDKYFASEIEPNAIKVTQKNYPETIQLGDVNGGVFMKIKYKIEEMFKLDGETKKEIPQDWNKEYEISVLRNGWSAILSSENNYLRTSTVKSFEIHGNVVKVTTKNTIYYLKPFISEVSND